MEFVGKKRIAAQCLAIAIQVFSADRADASLQDQIDTVFDSMVNTTTPGTYETQMRGVLAGGSLQMRNRIVNRNAVGFVPPSMGAGCGGIDLYGGSLSFINLDQFVGLLRGIASNSTGLAFQVAINAIDPLIGQTLENLQKKVQRLNEYMGSSCQLAQGVITDTLGAITEKAQFNEGLIAMTEGAAGDLFSGWGDEDGTDAPTQAMSANAARVAREITGNLVWRNLKRQDVSSWFVSGGDDALLEAIMSVTGTVIVGELEAAADGEGDSHRITRLPPGSIELDDLLVGGEVEVYRCDDRDVNACLNPTPTIMEIEGLVAKFQKTLTSATDDPGLVTQLRLNL
ncbi:MAG: conjugal transfer protein TraH, partial [Pseudomonadota bacterium]|nr:conjugal transfer protein TraH [Pseudomonadota bacterium]